MKKVLLFSFILLVLLCSCRTISPIGDQQYYQALGKDGDLVITVNAELLDPNQYIGESQNAGVKFLVGRMERVSVALTQKEGTDASDFSSYSFNGAIEGRYPRFLLNGAMLFSNLFSRIKDSSGLKYYCASDAGLEILVPESGLVLFSSEGIVDHYHSTYSDRELKISSEDAAKMAEAQIGLYIAHPKTMIDLGFEIPQSALDNISDIVLVLNDNLVSIEFQLKTEELAKSFSVIVRGSYIAKLKQEGQKVDIAALKEMLTLELDKVGVNNYELTSEQMETIRKTISSVLDMIG